MSDQNTRLLVMNGQRVLQRQVGTAWTNLSVHKAGDIQAGFYNLWSANRPAPGQRYEGAILHAEGDKLYQQVGRNVVVHDLQAFAGLRPPPIGTLKTVSYDAKGVATVSDDIVKLSRSRSR
ncbi:KfrB domain-containing protein [Thiocystis violacea]|uniref:KfrB domain-containing protein n=1 Tax=Thiocystis violacea TaxID=13725 RepID=UPI001908E352|nr:hypothetical protein [Thiocystis violacea]